MRGNDHSSKREEISAIAIEGDISQLKCKKFGQSVSCSKVLHDN